MTAVLDEPTTTTPAPPRQAALGTQLLIRTRAEWRNVLKRAQKATELAFDTETLDHAWPDTTIVGFSLAWREKTGLVGIYVPVAHATDEMQLAWKDVAADLEALLTAPGVSVAAHNAKYDHKVLALVDLTGVEWWDTMIASWLLNTNGVGSYWQVLLGAGKHGLKDLSKWLLKYDMTELTDIAAKEKLPNGRDCLRVDLVPLSVMADYAGDDAMVCLLLRERFAAKFAEKGMEKVYKAFTNIHREFTLVLADMEMAGVELDVDLLVQMRETVGAEMLELEGKLFAVRSGEDFPAIRDAELVTKVVAGYEDLERRFALPEDHPDRFTNPKTGKPVGKGAARKKLFDASGLAGHPVLEKVRDDVLRPKLAASPALAHKVWNPNSTAQVNRAILVEERLSPYGEQGKDGEFSTDAEALQVYASAGSKTAELLLRYRELAKIYGTYLVGMVAGLKGDGRVRTRFNQTGARTGRLSSSDPNLQNIPTSEEFPIRRAFVAAGVTKSTVTVHAVHEDHGKPTHLTCEGPGGGWEVRDGRVVAWWGEDPPMVLGVADYSQLEIRLLAHVSMDPTLVAAVTADEDIHALTARAIFDYIPNDMPLEEVKRKFGSERKKSKPVNFGVIYGQGPRSLGAAIGIDEDEAKEMINVRYMGQYPGVRDWIQAQHVLAVKRGYVTTAIGRRRDLPAAQLNPNEQRNRSLISQAKRQAQNTGVQGLAADVCALAMRNVRRALRSEQGVVLMAGKNGEIPNEAALLRELVRLLLQIHDELVWESHPAYANWSLDRFSQEMAGAIDLRVPLTVDGALGSNWLDVKP